ncbi:hypothetical protein FD387_23295 [Salmonella enterica]|nr:hypothetical protein [Salmonella enterica]
MALAQSQAELGIIPLTVAEDLEKTGKIECFDIEAIKLDIQKTGHSLVPLLNEWKKHIPIDSRDYIHFGATTQDIQDTSQSLELKEGASIIEDYLCILCDTLCKLIDKSHKVIMVGRTHGQPALPITLSLKLSVYLDQCIRALEALRYNGHNAAVSQLFGGVGTMASFNDNALDLINMFSKKLNLKVPDISWHVSRDRIVSFIFSLSLICGALSNIANEIIALSKDEIGELREGYSKFAIGSSTMPHKHNPENSERVILLYKLTKSCINLSFDSLCNEHERDYRSVRIEWVSLYEALTYTAKSLTLTNDILENLIINVNKIEYNLKNRDYILSEKLMFTLGELLGKNKAYDILFNIYNDCTRKSSLFIADELIKHPDINKILTLKELKEITNPSNYIGCSEILSKSIVEKARQFISNKEFSHEQ